MLEFYKKVPLKYVWVDLRTVLIPKRKLLIFNQGKIIFQCFDLKKVIVTFKIDLVDVILFEVFLDSYIFCIKLKENVYETYQQNPSPETKYFNSIFLLLNVSSIDQYKTIVQDLRNNISNQIKFSDVLSSSYIEIIKGFISNTNNIEENLIHNLRKTRISETTKSPKSHFLKRIANQSSVDQSVNKSKFRISEKYLYKIADSDSIEISFDDLECLKSDICLNDSLINLYITYVYYEKLSEAQRNRTYFFNCFFNTKLIRVGYEENKGTAKSRHKRVGKWTKNVDIFEKDFLIIPVIENKHWFLVIVCFPWMAGMEDYDMLFKQGELHESRIPFNDSEWASVTRLKKLSDVIKGSGGDGGTEKPMPCILIFDSFANEVRTDKVNMIRDYLHSEWIAKRAARDGQMVFNKSTVRGYCPKVPQQNNSTDCGVFMLHYLEMFYKKPIQDFSLNYFKHVLLDWFDTREIAKKRGEMLNSIMQITKSVPSHAPRFAE